MAFRALLQGAQDLHAQFHDILEKTDFSLPTFLAFGAALQLLIQAYLPLRLSATLPLLWLAYCLVKSAYDSRDVFRSSFTDVKRGRFTTRLPEAADGVVVFVLGARLNHPFGKLAPGTTPLDVVFKDMWREAEKNRERWGSREDGHVGRYVGRRGNDYGVDHVLESKQIPSIVLHLKHPTNPSTTQDLKGLHAFAAAAAHRVGQDGYNAGKYPYVGVMHELYHAPKGCYETIYGNFREWGLGAAKTVVEKGEDSDFKLADTLVPNQKGSDMFARMGKRQRQAQ
ncbi:hypothetical protein BU26DRAFT_595898 [Trematosphaeria pertusa]|uniref:Uncharacterized protein n=1 Tax=Trematosphaeria pertusa TaxID=390896 RepID=A0A6A6IDB0_9PLEO|nr:uncharacterized protein BU26DRAFT_595898 [Trematosphaeria pertusa]KAF2248048.1 hypothetical protein BU26DRAFT_595898 [Trematosphaeria pertusa]